MACAPLYTLASVLVVPANRHASGHAEAASHPIMSSIEPGESWSWCVIDETAFVLG